MDARAILKSDLNFGQKCSQTQTYIDLKNSMFCLKKKKKREWNKYFADSSAPRHTTGETMMVAKGRKGGGVGKGRNPEVDHILIKMGMRPEMLTLSFRC